MINQLTTYLKFGNRFYGLELTQNNGEDVFYGLVLKKKKKQLDIEKSFKANTLEDLKNHIPSGRPVSLVINTNAVLTKRLQSKTSDPLKLVYAAFPNIKVDEFYFETLSQGDYHFVSICRKLYVDDLLNTHLSKGITIIDFTLGNLGCSTLSAFIATPEITSSNATISIKDHRITDIALKENEQESQYRINGLDIKNTLLLSFASALNLIIKNTVVRSSFIDRKKALSNVYDQKRFANQFLKTGLSLLFIVLLINFLYFNHYYNKVNALRETAEVLEASKVKMIALSKKERNYLKAFLLKLKKQPPR